MNTPKTKTSLRHALAVEAGMKAYARRFGEDEEKWAVVGLIHDFEYEQYPDLGPGGHPFKGAEIMREMGWDEALIRAVAAHAPELTGVTLDTNMEKAIYAVDELTGLITATALVRPSKSILDVKVSSVRKKWKDQRLRGGRQTRGHRGWRGETRRRVVGAHRRRSGSDASHRR